MAERPAPPGRAGFPHLEPVALRWGDIDIYGHMNNAVPYRLFDTVVNARLMAAGLLDPASGASRFLVVESGCRYFREIRFAAGDEGHLHCGLAVERLGRSSVAYRLALFQGTDPRAAAEGHFVHVLVDAASHRPVPIEGALRRNLGDLAPGARSESR